MSKIGMKRLVTCSIFILANAVCAQAAFADQYAREPDAGYLELGLGYRTTESPLYESDSGIRASIRGRYQWHGLFVEYSSEWDGAYGIPAVGYNFYNSESWSLDVINAITSGDASFRYRLDGETKHLFRERVVGSGVRLTGSWGSSIFQVQALPYFNEDFSRESLLPYASALVGHRWRLKNWSLSGSIGARYQSAGYLNYYHGIDATQADALLPEYTASAGVDLSAKIALTYPLTRHWVFETSLSRTLYANTITNSPIVKALRSIEDRPGQATLFGIQLKYVF